nr:hypothetical protein [Tanacetum cinerariifolium]
MSFPKPLDSVPDPVENIFLRTGENTPYSGVWEPVKVPKKSLISLITGTPKPQPPFEIEGTMNYLHAGSKAPQVEVRAEDKSAVFNTTWRLIWADDRYIDGTIPDEEATYRFNTMNDGLMLTAVAVRQKEIVWAYSGSVSEVTGRWLVESDLAVGRRIANLNASSRPNTRCVLRQQSRRTGYARWEHPALPRRPRHGHRRRRRRIQRLAPGAGQRGHHQQLGPGPAGHA